MVQVTIAKIYHKSTLFGTIYEEQSAYFSKNLLSFTQANYFQHKATPTPGCSPGTAGRKDGNGSNRQRIPATGHEKPRRDLRQCRSRWSFLSEISGQGQPVAGLRCRCSLSGFFMCASNEPREYACISIRRLLRQRQLWRTTAYGE